MKTAYFLTYWLGSLACLGMALSCMFASIDLATFQILLAIIMAGRAFHAGWAYSRENLWIGRFMMGLVAIPFTVVFLLLFG